MNIADGPYYLSYFFRVMQGKYRVVLGIPEHVVNESWHQGVWKYVAFAKHVCLVAVDEVHCITEW